MLGHRYVDIGSYSHRTMHTGANPWVSLALAIVQQASNDYERLKGAESRRLDGVVVFRQDIISFLKSRWFGVLTEWCDGFDADEAVAVWDGRCASAANT